MGAGRKRQNVLEWGRFAFVYAMLAAFTFPILWIVLTSIKTRVDAFSIPPVWLFAPTLDNFRHVFNDTEFPRLLRNSVWTASTNTILSLLIGTAAAYGIARYRVVGQNFLFWVLSIRMLPPIVAAIPLFSLLAGFRLIDTYLVLPVLYLMLNLPLVVWLMRSFILDIPLEIEEGARIDGCSTPQLLWRIVVPLAAPGLVATAVFCFIFAWNELLLATIFTRLEARTASAGLANFVTAQSEIDWGVMCAAGTLALLPPVVLGLLFQRYIVRGLTFGAVK